MKTKDTESEILKAAEQEFMLKVNSIKDLH